MLHLRNFILSLVFITLFTNCDLLLSTDPPAPPNVVLILADDLGWKDVGFMGNEIIETPNLDRLAKEGMIFSQAYANAPNCAPTRACLMTGMYAPRHGIYTVNSSKRGKSKNRKLIPTANKTVLDTHFVSLPKVLKSAGYVTATMGKWHLGDDPGAHGFDINIGGTKKGHPKSYFSPYQNKNLKDGAEGEHLTDRLTNEAIDFVSKHKDQPFFLYLPYYAVHTPFQAKADLIKKYQEKVDSSSSINPVYAAMVEIMDSNIGRLHDALDSLGLDENTILIFTSDNGNHQNASSAVPLRGSKGMLYEGGIRVPFFVRWKGKIEAASSCEQPVISLDLFPTISEFTSSSTFEPPLDNLDGKSLYPLLLQEHNFERPALFWHFPAYLEPYKGLDQLWRQTPASAVRMGDWKLIETFETGDLELYNLGNDIGEQENLVHQNPEKTEKLLNALNKWREKMKAPIPKELNPEYEGL